MRVEHIREHLEKIEVLSDIYNDLGRKQYINKEERDTAELKMKLLKKEILMICYLVNKELC